MNRRQVLQYTAWITGASVSAPLAGAILSGCSRAPQEEVVGASQNSMPMLHFFSPDQFKKVTILADAILPKTDSPSASDVGVPETVDTMIGQVFDADYHRTFKAGWHQLSEFLARQDFWQAAPAAQAEALRSLELSEEPDHVELQASYLELKQQVVAYYLTSEEIGENYLNYLPIPGKYDPCISIEDVNNQAWAI